MPDARNKVLLDEHGIIREADKVLPDEKHKLEFLEALAELEDNECHTKRDFPKTRLHRVSGIKEAIYRADVVKVSGWRIHLQYGKDKALHLKQLVPGSKHDSVLEVIKAQKHRYS